MNPIKIIQKYYQVDSKSYQILIEHSKAVAKKAIEIANKNPHLNLDLRFIEEASMLHDIGIYLTKEFSGKRPYVCHGHLGREILEKEGLPKHALVCERHIGVGITVGDIKKQNLPLPKRNMTPVSPEEQIICFADNFFSKNEKFLSKEKDIAKIRAGLLKFGEDKVKKFDNWVDKFNYF